MYMHLDTFHFLFSPWWSSITKDKCDFMGWVQNSWKLDFAWFYETVVSTFISFNFKKLFICYFISKMLCMFSVKLLVMVIAVSYVHDSIQWVTSNSNPPQFWYLIQSPLFERRGFKLRYIGYWGKLGSIR